MKYESRISKSTHAISRYKWAISLLAITLLVSLSLSVQVQAVNPAGLGFLELDGNVVPGSCVNSLTLGTCGTGSGSCTTSGLLSNPTDWSCLFKETTLGTTNTATTAVYTNLGLPPNAVVSAFVGDGYSGGPLCPTASGTSCPDPTTYTSGSKDILDISANSCAASNNLLSKDNLVNTYGIKYIDPVTGHQIVYIGDEKQSNGGDNNIGVWFDQGSVSCTGGSGSGTAFTGSHIDGDILTVSNFTKGGILAGVNAYVWIGAATKTTGCPAGTTQTAQAHMCQKETGNVCSTSGTTDVCARVSTQTICGFNWVTQSKEAGGMNNTLTAEHCTAANSFYEMGIDLSALGFTSCQTTALPETRSSQQLTATIFDFTILNLNSCQTSTSTLTSPHNSGGSPPAVSPGASVTDTATVTSTSGGGTPTGSVQFYLCFSASSAVSCDTTNPSNKFGSPVTLDSGGSATSSAVSGTSTPNDNLAGFYCFSAVYTPTGGFLGSSSTTTSFECFEVVTSAISTSVSPATIALGSSATDTATVTLTPSGATVSGTVDFKVYGPVSTNTPTCTTLAGSFLGVIIGPGASPKTATSGSFTPSLAGYYFWTATYNPTGAANGNSVSTACGDGGETLVMISSSISTSVSPATITFGSSATDTATVTLTPSGQTVSGTVAFNVYGPFSSSTPPAGACTTTVVFTSSVSIGPGASPKTATSGSFTPVATGYYFWTATYNPAGAANGNSVSTACGDTDETLLVSSIPKITTFGYTNTPDTNPVTGLPDPTLGSGTVVFSFNIHNYGSLTLTLSGSLTVSGTATFSCTGGNTLTVSGSLGAGADAPFSLTCTYSGSSGQTVSALLTLSFTDGNGFTGKVSGSPATSTFTIQQT